MKLVNLIHFAVFPFVGAWTGCNAIIGLELGEPEGESKDSDAGAVDECEDIEFDLADCAAATWDTAFLAMVNPAAGRCSEAVCHDNGDGTGVRDIYMPKNDPWATYENLQKVRNDIQQPYIAPTNPEAWILCNLNGSPGTEIPMPPVDGLQFYDPAAYDVIAKWVTCGMPGPAP